MWAETNPSYAAAYFIASAILYATAYFTNPERDLFHGKASFVKSQKRLFLNDNAIFDTGSIGLQKVAFCATNRKLDSYKSFQN